MNAVTEQRPYPRPRLQLALCARCCVLDSAQKLVIETTRTADGMWLASRIVHREDPCPELPLLYRKGEPVAPPRGDRHPHSA